MKNIENGIQFTARISSNLCTQHTGEILDQDPQPGINKHVPKVTIGHALRSPSLVYSLVLRRYYDQYH